MDENIKEQIKEVHADLNRIIDIQENGGTLMVEEVQYVFEKLQLLIESIPPQMEHAEELIETFKKKQSELNSKLGQEILNDDLDIQRAIEHDIMESTK